MENPDTWGKAENIIHETIIRYDVFMEREEAYCGWSLEREITEALREAGLLAPEFKVGDFVMFADSKFNSDQVYKIKVFTDTYVIVITTRPTLGATEFFFPLSMQRFRDLSPYLVDEYGARTKNRG